jgi:hypothetical protein
MLYLLTCVILTGASCDDDDFLQVLALHKDRTNAADGVVRLVQKRPVDGLKEALLRGDQAHELRVVSMKKRGWMWWMWCVVLADR